LGSHPSSSSEQCIEAGSHRATSNNATPTIAGAIPANATAVAINLTGTDATTNTYLTTWPSGAPRPNDSGGFVDYGPISFDTQWYDWGDYAEGMVSRIRVNWYSNMPHLISTGLKGVVTIRFTIHRDGSVGEQ
jgi:hypothetical protein